MSFLFADSDATAGGDNSNINSGETMEDSASTAENTMGGGDDIGEEEDREGTRGTSQPRHRVIATDQGTSSPLPHQQVSPGTTDHGPARTKQFPGTPGQGPAGTKQFKLLLRILTVVIIVAVGIATCKLALGRFSV